MDGLASVQSVPVASTHLPRSKRARDSLADWDWDCSPLVPALGDVRAALAWGLGEVRIQFPGLFPFFL